MVEVCEDCKCEILRGGPVYRDDDFVRHSFSIDCIEGLLRKLAERDEYVEHHEFVIKQIEECVGVPINTVGDLLQFVKELQQKLANSAIVAKQLADRIHEAAASHDEKISGLERDLANEERIRRHYCDKALMSERFK